MSSQSPIVNATARPKIVPVVLPPSSDRSLSGRIRNIAVRGVDSSGWLQDDGEGGWALTKALEKQGRTTRSFPEHLLPKLVLDRQRGQIAAEFADPWNLPATTPTTGAVSEPKGKGK
jgi:hypothetical protein